MSTLSIPFALDPHGTEVPIDEAIRFKTNYYRCPECSEIVNPRKGEKRSYFAHKSGVLDDTTCSLASQADIDEMVDELRTSDIEKSEQNRNIRVYLSEEPGGRLRLFGVLPSLEWAAVPPRTDIDSVLSQTAIETTGIERSPVAQSFHPSNPEVTFELDPRSEGYSVDIEGPGVAHTVVGNWTSDSLSQGDLFVGDQTRARRFQDKRQIKHGEWVYVLTEDRLTDVPDLVTTFSLAEWTVLAFPARPETEDLLEEHSTSLTTDNYGFDADVVLPAEAHPTSDAPINSAPDDSILVGVVPAAELDPVFEIVSVPKRDGDTVELKSTGPGNPRYFKSAIPTQGSRRISVHQRNSSRHRLVHFHTEETTERFQDPIEEEMGNIGLEIELDDEPPQLSPLGEVSKYTFPKDFSPMTLPGVVSYSGPSGLTIEVTATFPPSSDGNSTVTRTTTELEPLLPNIGHWIQQGCAEVVFDFDGIGSVRLDFSAVTAGGTA